MDRRDGLGSDQMANASIPYCCTVNFVLSLHLLMQVSKSDLDQDPVLKGRLISLSRVDGHAKWVSPRVLQLMGELPDHVEGGLIIRDANGRPSGNLLCLQVTAKYLTCHISGVFVDNAMALIPTPEWTEERMNQFFDKTIKDALSHGLTSIHDAMSTTQQIQFLKK